MCRTTTKQPPLKKARHFSYTSASKSNPIQHDPTTSMSFNNINHEENIVNSCIFVHAEGTPHAHMLSRCTRKHGIGHCWHRIRLIFSYGIEEKAHPKPDVIICITKLSAA